MAATPNIMVSADINALAGNKTNNTIQGDLSVGGTATVGALVTDEVSTSEINVTTANVTGLLGIGIYTTTTLPDTGAIGQIIAIADSTESAGQTIDGLLAYWDATNEQWAYVYDNSAV